MRFVVLAIIAATVAGETPSVCTIEEHIATVDKMSDILHKCPLTTDAVLLKAFLDSLLSVSEGCKECTADSVSRNLGMVSECRMACHDLDENLCYECVVDVLVLLAQCIP